MLMNDLIVKKRDGGELSTEEIDFMIQGYTRGEIPDYQMSAMCMAIIFRGMSDRETLNLTMSMMNSGETLDLSPINGIKADKHSTGGVGDKTSLILCPMVSACGVKIAKMSGRGLGHTGGTVDKLESIPGSPPDLLAPPAGCPFVDRCEHAMYVCRDKPPLTTQFSESHTCSCWLYQRKGEVKSDG